MERLLLEQFKDVASGRMRNGATIQGYRVSVQKDGHFSGYDQKSGKSFHGVVVDGNVTRLSYGGQACILNGKYTLAGEKGITY
ncbi:MAG: hypothetical protein FWF59_01255 [Turicibacter sp.]|nr:hypothetical protein [Turicibacter sp.]